MQDITILKVGGKVVEDEKSLDDLLNIFVKIDGKKILVHGGGKIANSIAAQMGIETQMIEGRRITDAEMLKVVTMVYGGLVNKNVVAKLQAMNCNSLGLTGADLNIIKAVKRPVTTIDYGFAGDIVEVNTGILEQLLDDDVVPVFAPLTHNRKGLMLNTNADTIAQSLAVELSKKNKVRLIYCFEKEGVLLDINDHNSLIRKMDESMFLKLKQERKIVDGMIAKLENCFDAINSGVDNVLICKVEALSQKEPEGTLLVH